MDRSVAHNVKLATIGHPDEDKASLLPLLPFGATYVGHQRGEATGRGLEGALRGMLGGWGGTLVGDALGSTLGGGAAFLGGRAGDMWGTHLATRGLIPSVKAEQDKAAMQATQDALAQYKLAAPWGAIGQGMMAHGRSMLGGIGQAAQGAMRAGQAAGAGGGLAGLGRGLATGARQFLGTPSGRDAAMLGGAALAGGAMGRMTAPAPQQAPQQAAMAQYGMR